MSGSATAPSNPYSVSNQQQQTIRPYSPNYKDAMYDEPWPPRENSDRESEYYYKDEVGYQSTPDYNSLHYQQSSGTRDRNHGEDHRKRYQKEERNRFDGDRYSDDDGDYKRNNHNNRNYDNKHNNRNYDKNRDHDIGGFDYHDEVRAPSPPRDRNPNKGKSFPDNYDGEDGHRGSAFRQFFAGDGLAAPPPKRVRESSERRDRDRGRDRGRDRESSRDRKRRERNKSRVAIQQILKFILK